MNVLQEAAGVVADRMAQYGHPSVNHKRTAALFTAYLGVPVSERDVCMLNALQKISRDRNSAKRDNLVDVCGFMFNAELLLDGGATAAGDPADSPSSPTPPAGPSSFLFPRRSGCE